MATFLDKFTFHFAGRPTKAQKTKLEEIIAKFGGNVEQKFVDSVTHVVLLKESDIRTASAKKASDSGKILVNQEFLLQCETENKLVDIEPHKPGTSSGNDDTSDVAVVDVPDKPTGRPRRAAAAAASAAIADADADDQKKDDKPAKAPAKKGKTQKPDPAPKDDDSSSEDDKPAQTVKVIKKGKASVDAVCHLHNQAHILQEGDGTIWKATLNQTEIKDNNNKFYFIQLLESDSGHSYYVWNRWGRVGANGQNKLVPCGSKEAAKNEFRAKFRAKTGHQWVNGPFDTANYPKNPKLYCALDIDEGEDPEEEEKLEKLKQLQKDNDTEPVKQVTSKLDPRVRTFVEFISDTVAMQDTMKEFNIDVARFPLGKLTKKQIQDGYNVLKEIETEMQSKHAAKTKSDRILELSSRFYTLIPTPVGMKRPDPINTDKMLKTKMRMLEVLADIEIAQKVLKDSKQNQDEENPIDKIYHGLNLSLTPLDPTSEMYGTISTFLQNTHGATHNWYTLHIQDIFELEREGEKERFQPWADNKNRMLLYHGSRRANWMGILSQGLRIAPPEAPCTGYMFGKGVYFADMSSKSANYCFTNPSQNEGILMLCEVALGDMFELTHSMYMEKAQPNTQSTYGMGRTIPDPSETKTMPDGVQVTIGKPAKRQMQTSLEYNEFIVYDVSQIKCRYLIKLRFDYKQNRGFY
ncbi:putative poly ADP-ribose polymerase 2 [Blattamonas nauphoetae]|uniref:Poly [ADP-ribose] polymerase n=1 Tax=Blattamonas nauphoetae TaxID=2049346 RepID=A0ABQ9XH79_9EUKA|nr:putative poly ADP-ribose polymerase 2 [Blattamonas nauphoetae]